MRREPLKRPGLLGLRQRYKFVSGQLMVQAQGYTRTNSLGIAHAFDASSTCLITFTERLPTPMLFHQRSHHLGNLGP